jgi:hypothetical protein
MSDLIEEFWKILPVTRTLLASSLAVTLPVLLEVVYAERLVFMREYITHDQEVWRLFTTFFLGGKEQSAMQQPRTDTLIGGGIWYIFELWIL